VRGEVGGSGGEGERREERGERREERGERGNGRGEEGERGYRVLCTFVTPFVHVSFISL
jgi:hypothetical protein